MEIVEHDTGWTTGRRFTMNLSVDLYGYAVGSGDHSRYTEIDMNHVSMHERISSKKGKMESEERISLEAAGDNVNTTSSLIKIPGTQNYVLSVNEIWPVSLTASRMMDYRGAGISDREAFGNNPDYVGTSYLYTEDLRKERVCGMDLRSAWFQLAMNDSTNTVISDLFRPTKDIYYTIKSHSTGLVHQRYKQYSDKAPAIEGFDSYLGSFDIRSTIEMRAKGKRLALEESYVGKNTYDAVAVEEPPPEWIPCCMPDPLYDGGRYSCLWSCSVRGGE